MFFPMFVDLTKKEVLVVGAGTIAARRIHTLRRFVRKIIVVAPEICEKIEDMAAEYNNAVDSAEEETELVSVLSGQLVLLKREFSSQDLDDKSLVFVATDNHELNRQIYDLCKERMIPVNVSSDQKLCDFQFPSIVQDEKVVIGINASGKNHRLVKETRQKIEAGLGISGEDSYYK